MSAPSSVLVAGGGIVGLAAAFSLKRTLPASEVTVVDAGTPPVFQMPDDVGLRVSAISLGSIALLEAIGVWPRVLERRAGPYRAMRVWDARSGADGADALRFDAADFALPELGFIVENELLRDLLLERCEAAGVALRFECSIAAIEPRTNGGAYVVKLESGQKYMPGLLVGADGGASLVRREAGIASKTWRYPQSALVTHVCSDRNHEETAWQRFLPGGPLALLPLADGRCSVVWSDDKERVAAALKASTEELGSLLTAASDSVLGRLRVAAPAVSFPLRAQHAVNYTAAGLVLVGDAAHSIHPLAGQGVNLGLADVRALDDAVASAVAQGEHFGDAPTLRAYERERRGPNAAMLYFTDMLNRLFAADAAPFVGLRRHGMRLFNRSGPLRRRAVQVALGINV